jgi:heptosyltransferase II
MEVRSKTWNSKTGPRKILAIRFQALGDVVITLPYLQSLKRRNPKSQLHFLTRKEDSDIPNCLDLFDKVISIGGGRNSRLQLLSAILKLPWLLMQGYDVVLDLQNHRISRLLRKVIRPKAWSEFDKFSSRSAGERNQLTIEASGLNLPSLDTQFKNKIDESKIISLLTLAGWDGKSKIAILNPAGFFSSRNWPFENYIAFAKEWLKQTPDTQFMFIGISRIQQKAQLMKEELGSAVIDLTNKTTISEAFALVKRAAFMLTEDGGLMHMAWVQGVPTLALFGSSRSDWSAPQGSWSICLHSSDLECGSCMEEICKFEDNRCLTRYTPSFVCEQIHQLLTKCSL